MKKIYDDFPDFNIFIYKKFNINVLKNLSDYEIMIHYFNIGNKENLIASFKDFYNKYPNFDLNFFKIIYKNRLNLNDNISYLVFYNNIENKENYLINIKSYIKKYIIDIFFLKIFYYPLFNKNYIDIIKIIENDINKYILNENIFSEKYPDFNIKIYKIFNKNIVFNNNIKYKSYWYNYNKDLNNIVYSIDTIKYKYNDFDINIFKYVYNLQNIKGDNIDEQLLEDLYNNDNIIYSIQTFVKYIDDFNYDFFKKHNYCKNYDKNEIIDFYFKNIDKITYISKKLFKIKYPFFNILDFKKFNLKYENNSEIFTVYHNLKDKDNIIVSTNQFYNKYNNYNINIYKSLLNLKYKLYFKNDNEYIYHYYNNKNYYEDYNNYLEKFSNKYPDFNINLYKYFNNIKSNDFISIIFEFEYQINIDSTIIYSINSFYKKYQNFKKQIYESYNDLNNYNEEELILHFHIIGLKENLIYNDNFKELNIKNNFNTKIYKNLNKDLEKLNEKELMTYFYKNKDKDDRIYSIESFYNKYSSYDFSIKSRKYNFNLFSDNDNLNKLSEEDKIIYFMNVGIYKYLKKQNKNIVGRNVVNNIYEVLIDLKNITRDNLQRGISLIIRAKNEEQNIKECIESVVNYVDEIILVDNNSTDNTLKIMKFYESKYDNIKVYEYKINVSKVGIEHKNAIKNNNKNTLGTFYNWCLSKSTKCNVFKWDADFICIKNNFIQCVNMYDLKNRTDKFALWFSGKTLFENKNKYYLNLNSYYNEFRIFSYKNNFKWYDGDTCEYTDPYLNSCKNDCKYYYEHPLFYEIKRTSLDEFSERSSLIDSRDINDLNILTNLKTDNILNELLLVENNLLENYKKIIIVTPSLKFGGGNQFIINIYNFYKALGFKVIVVPEDINNIDKKYNIIVNEDIININNLNINTIKNFNPDFIIINSSLTFNEQELKSINLLTKIFFVTHSDVAYSNYYIQKYHKYFYKIITVNNYTINKLNKLLNIPKNKFIKIINYVNIKKNNQNNQNIKKNKKFGIISRFSEDKNIPMFIISLIDVFKKYPDYKCYLVGSHNEYYDNYLKNIIENNNLKKYIIFEGYQNNVDKYYDLFDFIILPSVSEGASYNIIEAMNYGLPVICSNVGGNHELIENENNGFLFNYNNIKNFEEKTVYITNYNYQLENIGYFINNKEFTKKYINKSNFDKTEVIIPFNVTCTYNECLKCNECKDILAYQELFDNNCKNISSHILKMINNYDENIKNISLNNKLFIKNNFNQNIYYNILINLTL